MNSRQLKKELLSQFVSVQKPDYVKLSPDELDECISLAFSSIPTLLNDELRRAAGRAKPANSIFISFTSAIHFAQRTTTSGREINEEVFSEEILPALMKKISALGIKHKYEKGYESVFIEVSELKKFCGFDKMKSLA